MQVDLTVSLGLLNQVCQLFTAELLVCALVSLCGICGGQSGTGTGFSFSSSVFPRQYHSTMVLHSHHVGDEQ
jgi:hypothetical protein